MLEFVTVTGIEALLASVTVRVQVPVSLPGCSVNETEPPVDVGFGVAELVSNATYALLVGAGDGTGLAVHASAADNVAALPASFTLTDAGAGLVRSNASDPGEATGVGDGTGVGLGLAVGLGDGLGLAEELGPGDGVADELGPGDGLAVAPPGTL